MTDQLEMFGRRDSKMRSDVKTLLEKLGQSQFKYQEFADRFSDLDTWPVFQSVIRDPRIFKQESLEVPSNQQAVSQNISPIASVFSQKYGGGESNSALAVNERSGDDVRTLLARISAAVDKGAI